jgi:molybdate transport system ATP-binding protein
MIELDITRRIAHTDFDLQIAATLPDGGLTALFGPSGAGKTTLLRLLAGLDHPDAGRIVVNGETWFDGRRAMPPQQRRVGMVFQDYALFPHLSVQQNVAFGAARGDAALIAELLEQTGLAPLAGRRPATLSGGQKQRVALARALASRPRLLLLDEPLSALDPLLRRQLQDMLGEMQQRFDLAVVLVSHDLAEVFRLADHVLHLERGRVRGFASPEALFLPPGGDRGRCQLHGEVLALRPADVLWRLTVLVGGEPVDILIGADEATGIDIGQRVVLSAGALHLQG